MTDKPPFTVSRYGSLGAALKAERDYLDRLNVASAAKIERLRARLAEAEALLRMVQANHEPAAWSDQIDAFLTDRENADG